MRLTCLLGGVAIVLSGVLGACDDPYIVDECVGRCVCGDGVVENFESCDDGNTLPGDGCDADCNVEPTCPNGIVEGGEACDDGNMVPGDGCEPDCTRKLVPVEATCVAAIPAFLPNGEPARGEDGEPVVLETATGPPDSRGACTLYVACDTIPGGGATEPIFPLLIIPQDAIALSDDRVRFRLGEAELLFPPEAAPSSSRGQMGPLDVSLEYRLEVGADSIPLLSGRTSSRFSIPRDGDPPAPIYLGTSMLDLDFEPRADVVPVLVSVDVALDIAGIPIGFDCEPIGDSRVELSLTRSD